MVAYNFMTRFAADVESGKKPNTIRAIGKRRPPYPGEMLQLYTGMRTRNCRLLREEVCTAVTPIEISDDGIFLDGRKLSGAEVFKLAEDDGFESPAEMLKFFRDTHGLPFEGVFIQWMPTVKPDIQLSVLAEQNP